MHISRVDLNLFVVLDAIYTEGSLTRASKKLHLTQPALSHALGRLRDLLDDPVFVRQGSQMVPTPFTRNLIGSVRTALSTLEHGLNQGQAFNPAEAQRSFNLGLRDVFEAIVLPPLMTHLQQTAPQLEISSVRVERQDIESELAQGLLDLAMDIPRPVSADIRQTRLARDRLVVVARADHPAIGDQINLDAYLRQQHILVSSRRKGPGLEDFELNRRGLNRQIGLRCQHYFAACRIVSQSNLLLTMPEQYARVANAHFWNRLHPFPLDVAPLDVHLYWHASADLDPANRWLREVIIGRFEEWQQIEEAMRQ